MKIKGTEVTERISGAGVRRNGRTFREEAFRVRWPAVLTLMAGVQTVKVVSIQAPRIGA